MTTKKISKQEVVDKGFFGPVYHGTNETARDAISKSGFKIHIGSERSGDISHGYQSSNYADGKPAPIHHLGYGVYFTNVKAIAKEFNGGSLKGLKEYYLDAPKVETINFGSQSNMMKWWVANGYDIPTIYPIKDMSNSDIANLRVKATKNLTDKLKSKWDAVWFKGKGIRKLLDGDQIAVFDPSKIYEVDTSLSSGFDIGAKVIRKSDGMRGVIKDVYVKNAQAVREMWKKNNPEKPEHPWIKPETKKVFSIKWAKGGTEYNVQDIDIEPSTFKKEVQSAYQTLSAEDMELAVSWLRMFIGADPGARVWGELDVHVPDKVAEQLEPYKLEKPTTLYRGLSWSSLEDFKEDMEAWLPSVSDKQGNELSKKIPSLNVGSKFPATLLGTSSWTKDINIARSFAKKGVGFILKSTVNPQDTLVDVTLIPKELCEDVPAACKESEVITISEDIQGVIIEMYEGKTSVKQIAVATFREKVQAAYQIKEVIASSDEVLDALRGVVQKKSFVKEWINNATSLMGNDDLLSRLGIDEAEYDEEMSKTEQKEEMFSKAEDWLDSKWDDFENEWYDKAEDQDGMLVGYRCIALNDVRKFMASLKKGKYLEDYKGIGKYFSWNEEASECHWGKGSKYVTVKALIPKASIDIKRTAWANMDIATGEEDEITLKDGAKVTIVEIMHDGKNLLGNIESLPAVAES